MKVVHMRCERLVDPLAIGTPRPRLSWIVEASAKDGRGIKQAAYQLLCATSSELLTEGAADLWDSGRIESPDPEARYAGKKLASLSHAFWRVRAWDQNGRPTPWSRPNEFGIGHLKASEWKARWIGVGSRVRHPAPYLRTSFDLGSVPARAVLYASALGLYELAVNGKRVGDHVLMPEWTSYHKRVHFQAFDVTSLLRRGENVIAASCADGWYAGRIGLSWVDPRSRGFGLYGDELAFLAELHLRSRGAARIIATDASWRCSTEGPILSADILDGELVDARRAMPGWDAPGFDDSDWPRATLLEKVRARLVPQPNEPLKVLEDIRPVEITEPVKGVYVVNLGQNITGWARLRLEEDAGRIITIRHGERLKPDGQLYTENLRSAHQTDTYIAAGAPDEVYEPRFTYHGFQYLEIRGLSRRPKATDVTGRAIWSSAPQAGSFSCSNPMLNRLASNILWTQRNNLTGVPTDCPQRDERLGWTGDLQVFCPTATYGMDMEAFLTKWLADLRDDQTADGRFPDFAPHPFDSEARFSGVPAWGDAGVIVPWRMYVSYGNRDILEQMFQPSLRWVRWIAGHNPDGLWKNKRGNDYGEWLNADTFKWDRYPKGRGEVPKEVFATLMFFQSADLLARIAGVLGRTAERTELCELAASVKAAFLKAYVSEDGTILGDTQAGYALALHLGILPGEMEPIAFSHLERGIAEFDGHLSTGFIATVPAMIELTRFGRARKAYEILEATPFPSWGYTVEHGGTTIWERWDGWTEERGFQNPGMNSFCHYAIGAVGEWMYGTILGIRPTESAPGYREIEIRPIPGGSLTYAKGHYDSIRGRIEVEWRVDGGALRLEVTVPATTSAAVWVPSATGGAWSVSCGTKEGVERLGERDGCVVFRVGSGTYVFTAPWSP